ncbi:Thioredoxin X, chloroplastic [Coccomyxa sp. Obi]|nr:Thioredoxin X, chloroplastic [Coccomyxa sp. Obi]
MEDTFEKEVLQADVPVLVDFWATWCGPCKLIAPLLKTIEQEYGDSLKIVKVEADPCPNLMEKYKVYGLPTLMLFKDGEVIEGSLQEGAIDRKKLIAYLERHGLAPVST